MKCDRCNILGFPSVWVCESYSGLCAVCANELRGDDGYISNVHTLEIKPLDKKKLKS